jgi:hypothetical protein
MEGLSRSKAHSPNLEPLPQPNSLSSLNNGHSQAIPQRVSRKVEGQPSKKKEELSSKPGSLSVVTVEWL